MIILVCVVFLQMADESLSFDEQILEAARAIMTAIRALMQWATATQRELVQQGRVSLCDLYHSVNGFIGLPSILLLVCTRVV